MVNGTVIVKRHDWMNEDERMSVPVIGDDEDEEDEDDVDTYNTDDDDDEGDDCDCDSWLLTMTTVIGSVESI